MDERLKKRLKILEGYFLENGTMPSYSQMCKLFGVKSKNAVFKTINKLIDEGFLKKDINGKLRFELMPGSVKILGEIKAGFPSPAEEELIDTVSLDSFLVDNPSATFMLKVTGDSMVNAGILAGDFVLVDRSKQPKDGDIVVASVDGEWTLKYLKRQKTKNGDCYMLIAANPKYKPIKPSQELYIAGVVVGVIRKYR